MIFETAEQVKIVYCICIAVMTVFAIYFSYQLGGSLTIVAAIQNASMMFVCIFGMYIAYSLVTDDRK